MLKCSNLKPYSLTELLKNTGLKMLKKLSKRLIQFWRITRRQKITLVITEMLENIRL